MPEKNHPLLYLLHGPEGAAIGREVEGAGEGGAWVRFVADMLPPGWHLGLAQLAHPASPMVKVGLNSELSQTLTTFTFTRVTADWLCCSSCSSCFSDGQGRTE